MAARDQAAANVKVARANCRAGARRAAGCGTRNWRAPNELLAQNFVSQSAYDTALARADKARAGVGSAQAAVAAAEANLRAAEVTVEQTVIRAPFDGVVLTKNANVGDTITPFSQALDTKGAVVTMADMTTLEVEADVSESNLQKVKVGQPCEIELDAIPGVRFQGCGEPHRSDRRPLQGNRHDEDRFRAARCPHPSRHEREGRVPVAQQVAPSERSARPAVSAEAVVERGGKPCVFVLREDKVERSVGADRPQDRRPGRADARSAARRQGRAAPARRNSKTACPCSVSKK